MRISLFLRISAVVVSIVLFSLLLNAFLNYFNFNSTYTDLVKSRYNVVLDDLKQAIEYNLNLGLQLTYQENIPKMIKEKKDKDETIEFLKVIDDKGKILFDTNSKEIGHNVSADWVEKSDKDEDKKGWSISDNQVFVIALPLVNNFNVKEGNLALGYSKTRVENTMGNMIINLTQGVLLILVVIAFITFVGVYLFSRRVIKGFVSMENSLKVVLSKVEKQQVDSRLDKSDEFEDNFISFYDNIKELIAKLRKAEKAIKKFDQREVDNK